MEEILALQKTKKISKNSIEGRIDNASILDEFKNTAILPKNSYITKLIILNFHTQYHHGNHETAINEIRQKYYVPRLRTTCKKIIRNCQMCKVYEAKPNFPQMAKLPRARLSPYVAPFTFTGVDVFGPILVVVNRHTEKRYEKRYHMSDNSSSSH